MLPGSVHKSGRRYEWEASSEPEAVPLADWPETWLRRCSRRTSRGSGARTASPVNLHGTVADLGPIVAGCRQMAELLKRSEQHSEQEWVTMLSVLARCQDGERLAHQWSQPYPRYHRDETQAKFEHVRASLKPYGCAVFRRVGGAEGCEGCPNAEIKFPIKLGLAPSPRFEVGMKQD